jgi:hypothetical protein
MRFELCTPALRGARQSRQKTHAHGGGRVSANGSQDIYNNNFPSWAVYSQENTFILKRKNVTSRGVG